MLIQILLLAFLTMWLGSPDGAVASETDMSIDEAIIAAYDSIPQSNRSHSRNFVLVELDMIYRLDVWESMMREEESPSRRKRRKAVRNRQQLWPNAVVPYELKATFSAPEVQAIKNAMQDYEKYTCIRFREKNANDSNFVNFFDKNGCSSEVGRQLSEQELSLGPNCRKKAIIIHELGHTIGLMHEHSRPDRDDYISINMTNIRTQFANDLAKSTSMAMDVGGIPYDYLSIMHYSERAGSNGNIVIKTKDPKYQRAIGKQGGLSFRDAKLINRVYRCLEQNNCRRKFCPGEGFVGQDCQCWCPSSNNMTAAEHCPRNEDAIKMELEALSRTEQWLSRQMSVIEMNNNRSVLNRTDYYPNATVPYMDLTSFRTEEPDMLLKAFEQFHTYSCLRFRDMMIGDDLFDDRGLLILDIGCGMFRIGEGLQHLLLGSICRKRLNIILRILSLAVGVGHEHNRPDRDDYITINVSNTYPRYFEKASGEQIYTGVPYNYLSIMHGDEFKFSRNGLPTILAKNVSYQHLMGRSQNFTFGDVKRLNMMYQCAELRNCSQFIRCPGSGFVGQDCKCWCPDPDGREPSVHCTGCTDFEEMCPLLSEYGYCTNGTFEEYVKYTCPRSCGLCSPYTHA